jgi:isoleucyl-tRNA synthetase
MFESVKQGANFAELEREIIEFWNTHQVFRASVTKPAPKGNFVFYEGPPTANGKPGIHHVSARAVKDLFPRFKTMQGYRVRRRGGWDTHGLPVEVEVEKEIKSTGKQDIERFGIAEFTRRCRDSVFQYIQDWNELSERIGFWVDLDDPYITYRNSYIESCWWLMHSLWERGLLYEAYRTTMHCPRCNCSLADHEVSQGMKEDVDDPSVWPKFPARKHELVGRGLLESTEARPLYFMAWTTTPWTLGANTALAVRGDVEYGLLEAGPLYGKLEPSELYIIAVSLANPTFGEGHYRLIRSFTGDRLAGLTYDPILIGRVLEGESLLNAHRVIIDDFVSTEDGTGIVHIAPAYGDLEVGRKHGLPTIFSVDLAGKVFPEVGSQGAGAPGPYSGSFFKEADKPITKDLISRGLMYRSERTRHAYPHCWRDDSPLLFYAKTSWYIRTTAIKDRLLANNQNINWVPDYIKSGRFGKWLENNVDWSISRERYWGTPLPIWTSQDGQDHICVPSVAALEELTGQDLAGLDLHRPHIDTVTFQKNGKTYTREPLTVDVWFDSGSMPYAQWHYPFENQDTFERNFPADFISEAVDQTRGWFYSLHALAALLTDTGDPATGRRPGPLADRFPDSPAFKNCVVLGLVLDAKGRKMSKRLKNAVDPWTILNNQGADALRWYFYSSGPVDTNKNFKADLVTGVVKDFFLTLWNAYGFFVLYANLDKPDLRTPLPIAGRAEIDRWLIARLNRLVQETTERLEHYDPTTACRAINAFVVDTLSNWYVRRNRHRFWKSENDLDKRAAYVTLWEALTTLARLCAPMVPFLSEAIYRNLVLKVTPDSPGSVHLSDWPRPRPDLIDENLLAEMDLAIRIIELGRSARSAASIKIRQPLSEVLVRVNSEAEVAVLKKFETLVLEELNVKKVNFLEFNSDFVSYSIRPNLPMVGKRLGSKVPAFTRAIGELDPRAVVAAIRRNTPVPVRLGEEDIDFDPEAFLVEVKSPEGYAAVEDGSYLAVLNTTLTQELISEGQIRQVLRFVQNARKKANLDIADRIYLGLAAPPGFQAALQQQEGFIKTELLAVELEFGVVGSAAYDQEVNIDGMSVRITLRRA